MSQKVFDWKSASTAAYRRNVERTKAVGPIRGLMPVLFDIGEIYPVRHASRFRSGKGEGLRDIKAGSPNRPAKGIEILIFSSAANYIRHDGDRNILRNP